MVIWMQENWAIGLVALLIVIALVWWLSSRGKDAEIAPPSVAPTTPPKPLEPVKPDIVVAEPARFKAAEPVPAPAPIAATEAPPAPSPAPTPTPSAAGTTASPDNLKLLKGVGPKLVTLLAELGVTRFEQIAQWSDADVAAIDARLGTFAGRITRDNWVDQASYLAKGDKAGFEAKYGALGGEL